LSVWVVKGKLYSAKALKEVVNKIRIAFKYKEVTSVSLHHLT